MKICYIDESGHCGEKYNPKQPIEVLCGVITDISKLFKTQTEHRDILELLNDSGIDISETGWDSNMIAYPAVTWINNSLIMIYNGNDFGANGFGYAILS